MSVILLPALRRARWVHTVQILVFVSWVMNPFPGAFSYWTMTNGVKTEVANPPDGDDWYQQDGDSDGFTNAQEAQFGSDPYRLDSDFDGLADPVEYQYSAAALAAGNPPPYDPWNWDTNSNGYSDYDEYYQQIQGYNPVVNYNAIPAGPTWTAGTYFSYSDADGDGIKNFEDADPVNMDRDGDGQLNWNDSYMDDPNNGVPPVPPSDPGVIIGGNWYPTGTLDSDGDGTPDQLDPFPYGSFWYQTIEYGGSWSDRDGDGVPDPADTFPDGSYMYLGQEYAAPWVDQDGDGIPNGLDPWPSISGSYDYQGTTYPGAWSDQDSDGIPDPADYTPNGGTPPPPPPPNDPDSDSDGIPDSQDAYPNDAWNGQPHYNYAGTEYPGYWVDSDSDGTPDPFDSTPNGDTPPPPPSDPDSDGDGIPDSQDSYPNDHWNGQPHYNYNGVEYTGYWVDSDGDGRRNFYSVKVAIRFGMVRRGSC